MQTVKTMLLSDNFSVSVLGSYTLSLGYAKNFFSPGGFEIIVKNMNNQKIEFSYLLIKRPIEKGPINFEYTLNDGLIEIHQVYNQAKECLCRIPISFIEKVIGAYNKKMIEVLGTEKPSILIFLSDINNGVSIRTSSGLSTFGKSYLQTGILTGWISLKNNSPRPSDEIEAAIVDSLFEDLKV